MLDDDDEAIFHLICLFLIETQYYQIGGPGPESPNWYNLNECDVSLSCFAFSR